LKLHPISYRVLQMLNDAAPSILFGLFLLMIPWSGNSESSSSYGYSNFEPPHANTARKNFDHLSTNYQTPPPSQLLRAEEETSIHAATTQITDSSSQLSALSSGDPPPPPPLRRNEHYMAPQIYDPPSFQRNDVTKRSTTMASPPLFRRQAIDIIYAQTTARLLQRAIVPPPPPGILPQSMRIGIITAGYSTENVSNPKKRDPPCYDEAFEDFHDDSSMELRENQTKRVSISPIILTSNIESEEENLLLRKKNLDYSTRVDVSESIGRTRTKNVINLSIKEEVIVSEKIVHYDGSSINLEKNHQPDDMEEFNRAAAEVTRPRLEQQQQQQEDLHSSNNKPDTKFDRRTLLKYELMDLPEASELAFQTLQAILKVHPKNPRVKRKVTKTRLLPRKTILSSLEDDMNNRDLDEDELAMLIDDLNLSSMIEDEYDVYEYDELDPYVISQEPIHILCHKNRFDDMMEEEEEEVDDETEEQSEEEYYEDILQVSTIPESWEYPNFDDDEMKTNDDIITDEGKSTQLNLDLEESDNDEREDSMDESDCHVLEASNFLHDDDDYAGGSNKNERPMKSIIIHDDRSQEGNDDDDSLVDEKENITHESKHRNEVNSGRKKRQFPYWRSRSVTTTSSAEEVEEETDRREDTAKRNEQASTSQRWPGNKDRSHATTAASQVSTREQPKRRMISVTGKNENIIRNIRQSKIPPPPPPPPPPSLTRDIGVDGGEKNFKAKEKVSSFGAVMSVFRGSKKNDKTKINNIKAETEDAKERLR